MRNVVTLSLDMKCEPKLWDKAHSLLLSSSATLHPSFRFCVGHIVTCWSTQLHKALTKGPIKKIPTVDESYKSLENALVPFKLNLFN